MMQATKTYKHVDGKMIHDGYFIYGDGQPLQWVAIGAVFLLDSNEYRELTK